MARKKKQEKKNNQANVHDELKGLEININPFGEIETNYDIQEINKFLNKHVDDKKLKEREELRQKGLSKDQQHPNKDTLNDNDQKGNTNLDQNPSEDQ